MVDLRLLLAMGALTPAVYVLSSAADAINNAAGFGFNGYDVDGSPQWDLISNLRIMDIEVGLCGLFLTVRNGSNGLLSVCSL